MSAQPKSDRMSRAQDASSPFEGQEREANPTRDLLYTERSSLIYIFSMKQLDKKAVWLFFLSSVSSTLIFSLIFVGWTLFAVFEDSFIGGNVLSTMLGWLILVVAVFTALSFIWAKLSYHYYRYELTDLGFRKESGVIWKKYVTIPYARIQNVDINRGILARLLGLSDLHIQTAGASASISRYGMAGISAEGRLPGVSKADAEVLRDELVKRASGSLGQGV